MQKSIVSQNMANPSMFPLPNRVQQYLPVFVNSPENFPISDFIKAAGLFPFYHSKHFLKICPQLYELSCYC